MGLVNKLLEVYLHDKVRRSCCSWWPFEEDWWKLNVNVSWLEDFNRGGVDWQGQPIIGGCLFI